MAAEPPTAGARSTTSTSAPASLAAVAAHIPAIPAPRTTTSTATSAATQLLGHGRDNRQRVADDPEVGELEERLVAILVDCDHAPRAADADDVLRRAAVCRSISTRPGDTRTRRAKVAAGTPSSSASAIGIVPVAPSVDSTPASTRSNG